MEEMKRLPDDMELEDLAEFLRLFSDPSRLKILFILGKEPKNVTTITEQSGMSQSAVSHQLAIMRRADIVRAKRNGKTVEYRIADAHIDKLLTMAQEHINEDEEDLA